MHERPTTDPRAVTPVGRAGPDRDERCPGRFDSWHCGLPQGHGGLHVAEDPQGRTTWNDALDGRDLGFL